MARRDEYESRVEKFLTPIMEENNYELVDVEYVKEAGTWYLRAYIDKPGGINVDDCEVVSRAFSDLLDEKDFIDDAYILEVSSPGLGRPLKKDKDFKRSVGEEVEIRTYRVIYECIEEIEAAMKGMLAPKFREKLLGHAEVRQTIRVPSVGTIAGCYITDGKIARSAQIRIVRDGVVIQEDKIASLRRFKDDVKEVAEGYECGVGLERFNDIKEGDVLEAFVMEEIKD